MIEAHVGLPGSGKTLHAVKRLLSERQRGRRTLANFHPRTDQWEFALWDDIREAGNAFVVIDEAHMWFSARTWTKQSQLELSYFQQHRKEGIDLVWIAQHENRVDVAVREVTAFLWRHRQLSRSLCMAVQTTPEDPKRPLKRVFYSPRGLGRHYFTEESIGTKEGEGYKLGGAGALAPAPRLEGARVCPNLYRVEFPTWVVFRRADDTGLYDLVLTAVKEWARLGRPRSAESLLQPFLAVGGRLQRVDDAGVIVGAAESKTALLDGLGEFLERRFPTGAVTIDRKDTEGHEASVTLSADLQPLRASASSIVRQASSLRNLQPYRI